MKKKIITILSTLLIIGQSITAYAYNPMITEEENREVDFISSNIWSYEKACSANAIYDILSEKEYSDELISGFIGNMLNEGYNGQIEAYNESWYWQNIDEKYIRMSGQKLSDMNQVNTLLELQEWPGIGVGMIQWSGSRRFQLLNIYKENECDFSFDSLAECEAKMIDQEVSQEYSFISEIYDNNSQLYENCQDKIKLSTGLVGLYYETYDGCYEDINQETGLVHDEQNVRYQSSLQAFDIIKSQKETKTMTATNIRLLPKFEWYNKKKYDAIHINTPIAGVFFVF